MPTVVQRPPAPLAAPPRATRSDGAEARNRLLHTALALFADRGFAGTSTREIAQAAGTNIAAIAYYFGDKAGLYAATFNEPMGGSVGELVALIDAPGLETSALLQAFFDAYVAPLKHGETARQCMRLHMREMIEPTGRWAEEVERDIRGPHEAMVRLLCRHLGLPRADDDVHRLALAVIGMAIQLFVMQDAVGTLRPALLDSAEAVDAWSRRLHGYAMALIEAEAVRRGVIAEARP
jgi:AcrR family transcriptional regulator